jgi:hypothetical protein
MADGVDEIQARLLPPTTVKLYVAGRRTGSGFFVASGTVVTCKHVLTPIDLDSEQAPAMIEVRDQSGREYQVIAVRHVSPDDEDLAVLRVDPGDTHTCALLASGLNAGDQVAAFGYTAKYETGTPVTLVGEGMMGNQTLFKLKQGQIEPGMSGSPVLNRRTGAVCGVLKRTRDARQELGGYAIPITTLLALSESIMRGNRAYHAARTEWLDLVPDATKQVWSGARASEPGSGPPHKTLLVSVAQLADHWAVNAAVHPQGTELGPVRVDLNDVRMQLARLFQNWGAEGPGRVDRATEQRLFGTILSTAVLPGEIGDLLKTLIATRDDGWLELALRFDENTDRDLEYLPWEHLYFEPRGDMGELYLARDSALAFTRTRSKDVIEPSPPPPRDLSALIVGAPAGEDPAWNDVGDAVQAVVDKAEAVMKERRIECSVSEAKDPVSLEAKIARERPDILHYVGYGQFDDGDDQVALCRAGGGREWVDSSLFSNLVDSAPPPRVVVMQLCDVPQGLVPVRADLAPFAPAILVQGVDALVAYQYPSRPAHSDCFNEHFYKKLAAGASVEMAVQGARKALYLKWPKLRAFLSPTVCVRHPGGVLLTAEDTESAPRSFVSPTAGYG